jgi:hypothetical protein
VWLGLWLASAVPIAVQAQAIAEGGSPLYVLTVRESVQGLKNHGNEKPGEAAKVCPQCGKVHAAAPESQANHAVGNTLPAAAQPGQPCPVCGQIHTPAQTAGQTNTTPLLAGAASSAASQPVAGKYYYCANCKVYHQTKPPLPAVTSPMDKMVVAPLPDSHTNVPAGGKP